MRKLKVKKRILDKRERCRKDFFYNDIHFVQSPSVTQNRGLQSKR